MAQVMTETVQEAVDRGKDDREEGVPSPREYGMVLRNLTRLLARLRQGEFHTLITLGEQVKEPDKYFPTIVRPALPGQAALELVRMLSTILFVEPVFVKTAEKVDDKQSSTVASRIYTQPTPSVYAKTRTLLPPVYVTRTPRMLPIHAAWKDARSVARSKGGDVEG
jgi:hypothetical protein